MRVRTSDKVVAESLSACCWAKSIGDEYGLYSCSLLHCGYDYHAKGGIHSHSTAWFILNRGYTHALTCEHDDVLTLNSMQSFDPSLPAKKMSGERELGGEEVLLDELIMAIEIEMT